MTAIAASGLRARTESLELLANNIANASTGGYKADREFYTLYVSPDADSEIAGTMPLIDRPWIDLSQGVLQETGGQFDLALSGKGFFAVQGPTGPLYTRNGSFRLAADGRLVTGDGYPLRAANAANVTLKSTLPVEISGDGTVRQDGKVLGKLEIADFTSTAGLTKQGSNYFRVSDPALAPQTPGAATVQQGKLEASNTGASEAAIRMMSVLRQFEMLQKAVSLGAEMNRRAVEEVAKVGS